MEKNYWCDKIEGYMDDFDLIKYQKELVKTRYSFTGMDLKPRVVGLVQVSGGLIIIIEENLVRVGMKVEEIK